MNAGRPSSARAGIHYWKCDRPAAFHGTTERATDPAVERDLRDELERSFPGTRVTLEPGLGQGNHLTFRARLGDRAAFVRVEDGPERDDYLEVESRVLDEVRALGLPVPRVLACDASRQRVSFAWQVLEMIPHPDLNELSRREDLDQAALGRGIGAAVARWQAITPAGFGPFDPARLRADDRLAGFHDRYADYFHLHLERHVEFLAGRGFLAPDEAAGVIAEIGRHGDLLALERGCLVHKDLALWNILGTRNDIRAFIDFDDAIAGDPMDDLSLLGCFHDAALLGPVLEGYESVRPLPAHHRRRFWLHLLRNMLVKSVIRVGAGYFDRRDGFFLFGHAHGGGEQLRRFTLSRLALARRGLAMDADLSILSPP